MEVEHPLKAYRKAKNFTQGELAKELGVARTTVARWESGARKIDDALLPKIAKITEITKGDLRPDLASLLNPEAAAQ